MSSLEIVNSGVNTFEVSITKANYYKCPKCNFNSSETENWKSHLMFHITMKENTSPICFCCNFIATTFSELYTHVLTHLEDSSFKNVMYRYKCEPCDFSTFSKQSLSSHMQNHSGPKPFHCQLCNFQAITKQSMEYHKKKHVEMEQQTNLNTTLINHSKENPPISAINPLYRNELTSSCVCYYCDFTTQDQNEFSLHLSYHNESSKVAFKCGRCNYKTFIKHNLMRHLTVHTEDKPFHCLSCTYSTALKQNLMRHLQTHRKDDPYNCDQCQYSALTKQNLMRHQLIHLGQFPFHCDSCSYKARTKENLSRHQESVHNSQKEYKCSMCLISFKTKSSLLRHLDEHAEAKPYQCHLCSYRAKTQHYLTKHLSKHSETECFRCQVCGQSFKTKVSLSKHLKSFH